MKRTHDSCHHRGSFLHPKTMDSNDGNDHQQWRRREWDGPPESVAVDSGYQSAGALSDGFAAAPAESGYSYNTMRSSGSVGSHGSGERAHAAYLRQQPIRDALYHVMNGETRFPTAFSYAASEAAKSDIATVCSGSVTEDIEVASVLSAEYNVAQIPNNLLPSPPSSERSTFTGNRRTSSGGRVEFAALPLHSAAQPLGYFPGNTYARQSGLAQDAVVYDMGPPLSRALLLGQSHASGSRPGSVRSFGSTAGASSDVVAHVDTDDCGGSFTDGHSTHSQEDNTSGLKVGDDDKDDGAPKGQLKDDDGSGEQAPHPLLNCDSSQVPANGRVSPGGTIYKGRGVRRYQGRYMNLPLKRFHQNGVNLSENGTDFIANGFSQNGFNDDNYSRDAGYGRHEYNDDRARRWPRNDHRRQSPSPDQYDRRKRSRSRTPQNSGNQSRRRRSRSRSWRSRSRSPKDRYNSHHSRGGDRYSRSSSDRHSESASPSRQRRRRRNGERSRSR